MSVKIKGGPELLAKLRGLEQKTADQVAEVVAGQAQQVLTQSQALCPVDTGALRDSAYVTVQASGSTVTAQIGYSAPHALAVHERTWVRHKTGQAKFLTDPLDQAGPELKTALAAKIGGGK